MGGWEDNKPVMAMVGVQLCYAGATLFTKAAILQGLSPRVLVVYRQALATLAVAPIAYISRVTINQNMYYEGLDLATSSIASAMPNLVPAITFLLASIFGLEKVNVLSLRSIAKIVGTIICVSGAIFMALFKGPKLLNSQIQPAGKSLIIEWEGENLLLGCVFLLGSACCWSIWLILQVPASASYPDHVSLSAWMCFIGTLQSAAVTLFLEPDIEAWTLHSSFELFSCLFVGILGSGLSFFLQAWCIAQRGPLFSAMFNPLCTVIVTILAALFLHEEIYMGSLIGAVGIIGGLYIVLWGKAEDLQVIRNQTDTESQNDQISTSMKTNLIDESNLQTSYKIDLEEPLLSDR
ncbi:Drug/metabolite transporter [Corchorus capsularis]|uniref:WAT1-related protein n=1 Tax=Corchorus capsularis TaxID=210143 RepID=A0A1R3GSG6_COCAP|nr:Drug/metabolite transporter [Corchorus capsularis]